MYMRTTMGITLILGIVLIVTSTTLMTGCTDDKGDDDGRISPQQMDIDRMTWCEVTVYVKNNGDKNYWTYIRTPNYESSFTPTKIEIESDSTDNFDGMVYTYNECLFEVYIYDYSTEQWTKTNSKYVDFYSTYNNVVNIDIFYYIS